MRKIMKILPRLLEVKLPYDPGCPSVAGWSVGRFVIIS